MKYSILIYGKVEFKSKNKVALAWFYPIPNDSARKKKHEILLLYKVLDLLSWTLTSMITQHSVYVESS